MGTTNFAALSLDIKSMQIPNTSNRDVWIIVKDGSYFVLQMNML